MKILKSTMLAIALLAIFGTANAAKLTKGAPLSAIYVLKVYIAATTRGDLTDFEKVLDNNVIFTTTRNNEAITLKTEDVLSNLKANAGIIQDCTTTTTLVKETGENTVYEVDVKYADYVRANYITLVGSDESGWRITNVNSVTK